MIDEMAKIYYNVSVEKQDTKSLPVDIGVSFALLLEVHEIPYGKYGLKKLAWMVRVYVGKWLFAKDSLLWFGQNEGSILMPQDIGRRLSRDSYGDMTARQYGMFWLEIELMSHHNDGVFSLDANIAEMVNSLICEGHCEVEAIEIAKKAYGV